MFQFDPLTQQQRRDRHGVLCSIPFLEEKVVEASRLDLFDLQLLSALKLNLAFILSPFSLFLCCCCCFS